MSLTWPWPSAFKAADNTRSLQLHDCSSGWKRLISWRLQWLLWRGGSWLLSSVMNVPTAAIVVRPCIAWHHALHQYRHWFRLTPAHLPFPLKYLSAFIAVFCYFIFLCFCFRVSFGRNGDAVMVKTQIIDYSAIAGAGDVTTASEATTCDVTNGSTLLESMLGSAPEFNINSANASTVSLKSFNVTNSSKPHSILRQPSPVNGDVWVSTIHFSCIPPMSLNTYCCRCFRQLKSCLRQLMVAAHARFRRRSELISIFSHRMAALRRVWRALCRANEIECHSSCDSWSVNARISCWQARRRFAVVNRENHRFMR